MAVKRMDNVGIVVEGIDAAIEFFMELGLGVDPCSSIPSSCLTIHSCEAGRGSA